MNVHKYFLAVTYKHISVHAITDRYTDTCKYTSTHIHTQMHTLSTSILLYSNTHLVSTVMVTQKQLFGDVDAVK